MRTVSLEMASLLTGRSRRTWWRRISDGSVARVDGDARGRARLSLDDVVPHLPSTFDALDVELVIEADAGDASALNDLGQALAMLGRYGGAKECWEAAAAKDHPDAMQSLGSLYVTGKADDIKDINTGIMWIAKAAAAGHLIAMEQMRRLYSDAIPVKYRQ